ncbi:MAG: hypothetical protein KDA62_08565 [Planctomycetales bacterium]|nr:hypothetical protein [Planctomycetales bacterium]
MPIPIESLEVAAYTIPTDEPESDGTLKWDSTTLIVVHVQAGGQIGMGFTYCHASAAKVVDDKLRTVTVGSDGLSVERNFQAMWRRVRNMGRPGIASCAISAVDIALWDLKARLLSVSLIDLLGGVRDRVAIYGSGGFTSYDIFKLKQQLCGWQAQGISQFKMKVGRQPDADLQRVGAAREAVGPEARLFVDANGAYDVKQALTLGTRFCDLGVTWYEEPVSSDNLSGLKLLRERSPAPLEIAAGEYGYDVFYFRQMLENEAVDVLQVDMTRCGGVTAFMKANTLCEAFSVPLSAHTAPAIHAHVGCCSPAVRHVEYFHDHVRIEGMLFDGVPELEQGTLAPDRSCNGHGMTLRMKDAERFRISY